jgi:hypothetical protein
MSNVIHMLEQLAVNTGLNGQRDQVINELSAEHQLSSELEAAIQQADLSKLIIVAGANGGGAPFIVAPDDGESPAEDDEKEEDREKISH